MKVLTVKNPWAHLIMSGYKDIENRVWQTPYRGTLAIHVGADPVTLREVKASTPARYKELAKTHWRNNSDAGLIIGTVDLVDIVHKSRSPWAIKSTDTLYYYWVLANPVLFDQPIKIRGCTGIWDLPDGASDLSLSIS